MSGTYSIMRCGIRDQCAKQAEEIISLQAERDALKAELESVLGDWNALVRAVGSPTNGGAVGHAAALKAESERLYVVAEDILSAAITWNNYVPEYVREQHKHFDQIVNFKAQLTGKEAE